MTTVDPERCPLCGEPNACASAAASRCGERCRDCWCVRATIGEATLARIPPAARGVACICARCAKAAPTAPGGDAGFGGEQRADQNVGRGRA